MKTIADARQEAANNLNYDLAGGKGANLPQDEFFQLEAEMARVVMGDQGNYDGATIKWASTRTTVYVPATLGLGEAASIFTEELGNQAVKLNDTLNPLSENNRAGLASTVKTLVYVAVIVAVVIYVAPYAIKNFKKGGAVV